MFARPTIRPIRNAPLRRLLSLETLENRIAPSVSAIFDTTTKALAVSLSAADDQAVIAPSGSNISVSGTNLTAHTFSGVASIVVVGANTSTQDSPNQGVTFGGGGTITLHAASDTEALKVSGVTFGDLHQRHDQRDLGRHRRRGLRDHRGRDNGCAGGNRRLPSRSISSGATLKADNVKLEARASSTYESEAALGGARLEEHPAAGAVAAFGFAAAIADLEPSATVTVDRVFERHGQRGRRERRDRGRGRRQGRIHHQGRDGQPRQRPQPDRRGDRRLGRQFLGDRPCRRRLDGQRRHRPAP